MLRKEVEVVIFFTWWDLVRISWILVRICPEQEHDYSHLIVINDSKLDCDVDLIKLSASGGNRKMRSMLLKQGVHLQGMRPRGGRSLNDVSLNTFEIFKVRFSRCSGKNIIEHSGSITEL
ncbi:hypothetical protein DY000_02059804 [Brassica cretica]|uniref:Uncharacterized protein n=1 Tax=Brassica cretica TaxID=69181 RepID=A0ABQ7AVZ8_BRACR|nr:hypothetical protein DY000_02059804 [Brassica cretica]